MEPAGCAGIGRHCGQPGEPCQYATGRAPSWTENPTAWSACCNWARDEVADYRQCRTRSGITAGWLQLSLELVIRMTHREWQPMVDPRVGGPWQLEPVLSSLNNEQEV